MNKREIADHEDVSVNTISRWVSLGCPHDRDERGRYIFDPEDVETWRHDNIMPTYNDSDSERPSLKEIAAWGLNFAQSLLCYIEKCKHCRNKIMQDAKSGKFGNKR